MPGGNTTQSLAAASNRWALARVTPSAASPAPLPSSSPPRTPCRRAPSPHGRPDGALAEHGLGGVAVQVAAVASLGRLAQHRQVTVGGKVVGGAGGGLRLARLSP